METINKKKFFSKFIYSIIFLILVFFSFAFLIKNNSRQNITENQSNDIKIVYIGGKNIKVELATSYIEQERGLSGKENIEKEEGMLFIFPKPSINFFWMKDMKFPIDMIWIDENFSIIFIKKDAKPESYPESFGTEKKSKYVLEVSSGFAEMNNLKEGDKVKFLP